MGLFTFLLVLQAMVALLLITLILMQRSEGGGLAGGGSPAGMMSARGAADFLTRGTAILATIFVALSIVLAALAASQRTGHVIDPNLARPIAPGPPRPRHRPASRRPRHSRGARPGGPRHRQQLRRPARAVRSYFTRRTRRNR
jgi:preprotein translocase subunit SecG